MHLFACRAVKRERRKGSFRPQQTAYGAAVNEVACELLPNALAKERKWRPKVHQARQADRFSSRFLSLPLTAAIVPPVPPLYCSAPHCLSLLPPPPPLSLSLFLTRFDAFKDVMVLIIHNMLPILGEQPQHLGYRPVYLGFPYDL